MIKQSYEGGDSINEIISKLKGINSGAVGELGFVSYLITLLYGVKLNATFTKLSSKGHLITMEKICKQALSNFDDKIRIQSCGIHIKNMDKKHQQKDIQIIVTAKVFIIKLLIIYIVIDYVYFNLLLFMK